jgi:hypothetical protein
MLSVKAWHPLNHERSRPDGYLSMSIAKRPYQYWYYASLLVFRTKFLSHLYPKLKKSLLFYRYTLKCYLLGAWIWGFGRPIIGLAKLRLRNILSTFSANSTDKNPKTSKVWARYRLLRGGQLQSDELVSCLAEDYLGQFGLISTYHVRVG